jgi:hypothetical protein
MLLVYYRLTGNSTNIDIEMTAASYYFLCYTVVALSDLAVSSGLPAVWASLPGTDFSPKPLERLPISLPPGDFASDREDGLKRGFDHRSPP